MTDNRNFDEGSETVGRRQRAIEAYGNARDRAGDALDEAPLIALAGGLAAGALIAALLPRTRTEERLIRPYADRARETARSAAQAAKDKADTRIARRRPVVVGYSSGNFIEIREGLKEGDRVVTVGRSAVRDGTKIQLIGSAP